MFNVHGSKTENIHNLKMEHETVLERQYTTEDNIFWTYYGQNQSKLLINESFNQIIYSFIYSCVINTSLPLYIFLENCLHVPMNST